MIIKCIWACAFFVLSESVSIKDIKKTFSSKVCIEGSLATISIKSSETLSVKETNTNDYIYFGNVSSIDDKDSVKSPLTKLHELAQYNEIKYFFKLEKEEGPPHKKVFTVSLTLGDETYVTQGTSLKQSQQELAGKALENTEYDKPLYNKEKENEGNLTPTVLLNNLSTKFGIKVEYFVEHAYKDGSFVIDGKPKKGYLQKLNDSIYSENDLRIKKEEPQMKGPFKVRVEIGDTYFYGVSHTIQSARHKAAAKAMDYLLKHIQEEESACLKEGSEDQCQQAKAELKSPISSVFEAAQIRNLGVEFDIISESGPPHKKVFITRCRLGHMSTEGKGNSKKESKKAAAVKMLDRLYELPEVPLDVQSRQVLKDKGNKKKKKKNKILKTNFDVVNMHLNNFVGSILDLGLPFTNVDNENSIDNSKQIKNPKKDRQKHLKKSYQDKILELGNLLNFEIQFMDFDDTNQFYTLMSLHLNPQHICLGQGSSKETSRDKAAKGGLKLLYNIPFEGHFKDKKDTSMESEVKEKLFHLLNQEFSEEEKEENP